MIKRGQADAPAGRHGGRSVGMAERERGAASTALLSAPSLHLKGQTGILFFFQKKQYFYFNVNMFLEFHFFPVVRGAEPQPGPEEDTYTHTHPRRGQRTPQGRLPA